MAQKPPINKYKPSKSSQSISSLSTSQNSPTKSRIQSASNDVFNSSVEMDDSQVTLPTGSTSKRNLSSTDNPVPKKNKSIFITANRYSPLATENENNENTSHYSQRNVTEITDDSPSNKIKLPPPIFVRGVLDFVELRNQLIKLIGSENFSFKSSTNDLKIQTTDPESYRKLIHYLKDKNAQYHTYQPQEDKAFRIVIRNLHPSTPTNEIGIAIEEIGFSVRQVANVLKKITKDKLPMFFVDLEPAPINNDIFSVTSLLHTKVKIEEPHKRRDIIQCQNCQDYGHSKKYCSYQPRCVRCGENHPTSNCTKSYETPAKCALCQCDHPANYKGCQVYKQLQRSRKPTTNNPKPNFTNSNSTVIRNVSINNNECKTTQQQPTQSNPNPYQTRSYAQVTSDQNPNASNNNENATLSNFINEFKALINPLLSLLTTVLDRLLAQNAK